MNKLILNKIIKVVVWGLVLVSIWFFLQQWFAPDACLDFGGSFDYILWQCSHDKNHQYISVPIYNYLSFWLLISCLLLAIITTLKLNK